MVKGYDPTKSDVASLFLNYILEVTNSSSTISLQQSHQYVQFWLKHSPYTSSIYKKFNKAAIKPQIKLNKHCGLLSQSRTMDNAGMKDTNFPTAVKDNQITICLDTMRNKLQLKQNLDRQLTFFYHQQFPTQGNTSKDQRDQDKQLMHSLYDSCRSGYLNYMLPQKVTNQMAIVCSKYLFLRKTKNNLPIDRLFRYTSQLADNLLV